MPDILQLKNHGTSHFPSFIVWDSRDSQVEDKYLVRWIRDNYRGCPIIAIVNHLDESIRSILHRLGISIILEYRKKKFWEDLNRCMFAIVMDQNKKISLPHRK